MNKKECFSRLLKGEPIDRTLFRPIVMHFAARYAGHTYGELASDYKVLVESNMRVMEDFDTDMVGLISDPYRETSAFGAPVEFLPEAVPRCNTKIVTSYEDVQALKNPDVYKSERTRDRIKGAEYYQQLLKGEVPVIGWIEGPLAEAADLAGVSEMLMQLMTDPDFSNSLLDKCVVTAKDFAKAQLEAGCDIIGMGDAICSQIDPNTYATYVKDRQKEIVDFIHEQGGLVKLHICGDITHLLSEIKDLGVDILDLDWQVDLEEAYKIVGPDVIRCGNINPVDIQDGSYEEVKKISRTLINNEKHRKYILSAGCEITVNTPIENLRAMREASYI
ncbi:MAG: uroporphyrinogen decarboxylase family protein [Bacteroidales bacterium]|nr:uroporphyrinogen decarboxylase family protein [Bacteroidales bacterium]